MKKIIASAVGLMLVGGVASTASAALENQFGGYWRTRFTYEDNFSGQDTSSKFYVDQRTRLYYTAKFSDDFKFVNKFEFNSAWGDATGVAGTGAGGDIGADGKGNWRIKNSYADFNVGPMANVKVGIQPFTIARGFIFDDDASGAIVTGKFANVTVPFIWIRAADQDAAAWDSAVAAKDNQNILAVMAAVKVNDNITVTPYFVDQIIGGRGRAADNTDLNGNNWYLGVDADMKFGTVNTWATAIYNGGQIADVDNKGYLGAVGADAGVVHGQFFYASGPDGGSDNKGFVSAPGNKGNLSPNIGSSYYWAEIMGYGIFDNAVSNGSPEDDITNIWAGNVGVTVKPIAKLQLTGDIWYASLAEANAAGDKELGWELDGVATYSIYDNLSADVVIAYLISGDATGPENITEGGVRLSLKF